jgi:hypothetical protein
MKSGHRKQSGWSTVNLDCEYVTRKEADHLNDSLAPIGRMLNSMIEKASSFCGNEPMAVREDSVEYFTPRILPLFTVHYADCSLFFTSPSRR